MTLLRVQDLTISRTGSDAHIVRAVGFSLEPGETLGIAGESGCGKSTLLLALMGVVTDMAVVLVMLLLGAIASSFLICACLAQGSTICNPLVVVAAGAAGAAIGWTQAVKSMVVIKRVKRKNCFIGRDSC